VIPKPRAEVRVLIGDPIDIPPQIDAAQAEALRLTLEQRLIAMHVELDSRTGYTDTQPLQAV
jgi:hypothetical protein